jgi:hypothetical protein
LHTGTLFKEKSLTIFLKDDGIEDPMDEVVVKRAL